MTGYDSKLLIGSGFDGHSDNAVMVRHIQFIKAAYKDPIKQQAELARVSLDYINSANEQLIDVVIAHSTTDVVIDPSELAENHSLVKKVKAGLEFLAKQGIQEPTTASRVGEKLKLLSKIEQTYSEQLAAANVSTKIIL